MKLSELVEHTGKWLGFSATSVSTFARALREAKQISGGIKGGGAADMNVEDKISLFVAVLGCGTARTCAEHLPRMLVLPAADPKLLKGLPRLSLFDQPDLRTTLLALFRDIQTDNIELWRRESERILSSRGGGSKERLDIELMLRFEVDGDYVKIVLEATRQQDIGSTPGTLSFSLEKEFGHQRGTDLAGFSRRVHEINLQRLAGWGRCLQD